MYAVQTKTGSEHACAGFLGRLGYEAKAPEKIMIIRRGGTWLHERKLIFSGYIFIDSEEIKPEDYYRIKNVSGVINFLGKGSPEKLSEPERQHINWLWNGGKPIEPSKIYVTAEGIKSILSGPLRKYRGGYIDYDLRHKRVRIEISVCGVSKRVTLPAEYV